MLKWSFITALSMLSLSPLALAEDHLGAGGTQRQQAEGGLGAGGLGLVNGQCSLSRPGATSAIPQAASKNPQAAAFLQQLCISCHTSTGQGPQQVQGLKAGGIAAVNNGSMPKGATLSDAQKAQVIQALQSL